MSEKTVTLYIVIASQFVVRWLVAYHSLIRRNEEGRSQLKACQQGLTKIDLRHAIIVLMPQTLLRVTFYCVITSELYHKMCFDVQINIVIFSANHVTLWKIIKKVLFIHLVENIMHTVYNLFQAKWCNCNKPVGAMSFWDIIPCKSL